MTTPPQPKFLVSLLDQGTMDNVGNNTSTTTTQKRKKTGSRDGSIALSLASTTTRLKLKEIEKERKLLQLQQDFVTSSAKLEDEIANLKDLITDEETTLVEMGTTPDDEKPATHGQDISNFKRKLRSDKRELKSLERQHASMTKEYLSKKEATEREAELDQKEEAILEEEANLPGNESDESLSDGESSASKNTEYWVKQQNKQPPLPLQGIYQSNPNDTTVPRSYLINQNTPPVASTDGQQPPVLPPQPVNVDSNLLLAQALRDLPNAFKNITVNSSFRGDKKLPDFDGSPIQYGKFKAFYDGTTAKYTIQNDENLMRLTHALKGKAHTAVEHLLVNADNVPEILEVLKQQFGSPEIILNSLMQNVRSLPSPQLNKRETIVDYGTAVAALVTNIKTYKEEQYLFNPQLMTELFNKLPGPMQSDWLRQVTSRTGSRSDLSEFSNWLKNEMNMALVYLSYNPPDPKSKPEEKDNRNPRRDKGGFHAAGGGSQQCSICDMANHSTENCGKFKRANLEKRFEIAEEKRLCFLCLRTGHVSPKCYNRDKLKCETCSGKHHTLLHGRKPTVKSDVQSPQECDRRTRKKTSTDSNSSYEGSDNDDDPDSVNTNDNVPQQGASSQVPKKEDKSQHGIQTNSFQTAGSCDNLPIIKILAKGPKRIIPVYCLFDSGASFSMIEEEVADQLGLTGKTSPISFHVYGSRRREISRIVNLKVSPAQRNTEFYSVKGVQTLKSLNLPARSFDAEKFKKTYPHLKGMNAMSIHNARPQMVLGMDVYTLYCARQVLEIKPGQTPAAVKGLLGWYPVYTPDAVAKHFHYIAKDEDLLSIVNKFFALETMGVKLSPSRRTVEDEKAIKILEETTIKRDGRWETGLLWKDPNLTLPPSNMMAQKRLTIMERKMDNNPEFATIIQEKFEDYISKGYVKKVEPPCLESSRTWFLPWFLAYHPIKKPRLVMDGAAKVHDKSLNDFLLKGPDLILPLAEVLLRFRLHKIALTSDIKEMFHQVALREEDRPSQTVLYRGMDRLVKPEHYQMSVLFFGSASSPTSAIYTKNLNAEHFNHIYPSAVQAIKEDMYVDDYLGGEETISAAVTQQKQMTKIMQSGGFPLIKWASSSPEVLKAIPEQLRSMDDKTLFENKEDLPMQKTLGLLWSPSKDTFGFQFSYSRMPTPVQDGSRNPTLREVTSFVMTVFDPLGFLAPVKMKGLYIIQLVHRHSTHIDWDDEVPTNVMPQWNDWISVLGESSALQIPRKMTAESIKLAESCQLHVFCDASADAYAAVAFLRTSTGGRVEVSFVMGKSFVAPVKGFQSIPRAELQAALIAARLSHKVYAAYKGRISIEETVYWSDSRTVLQWIRATNKRFKVFVVNRVGEIHELSKVKEWRWIPTKLNIADDGTRPGKSIDFSDYRWISGESFLYENEANWPKEPTQVPNAEDNVLEEIKVFCTASVNTQTQQKPGKDYSWITSSSLKEIIPDMEQFSCWKRLVYNMAIILKLKKEFRGFKYLTIPMMTLAEKLLIRKCQEESFPLDLKNLQEEKELPQNSRIKQLTPYLDEYGIIVMNGRIKFARGDLPILDPAHPYTRLLIKFYHEANRHFGQDLLVSELRQKAWILSVRVAVRRCKAKCLICLQRKVKPVAPLMGPLLLPRREQGHPPFYYTGVDYFGPILCKQNRSQVKRYGVIFTCLTSRAVHLEVSESLDTNDMIDTLVRFIGFRGKPWGIWSDNGTNFVGANREMKKSLEDLNQKAIKKTLLYRGIEWFFICPRAPHMGGSWERLIGLTKRILMDQVKEVTPRESTLRTYLAEATGILNNRPISFTSASHEDMEPLTPNHILNIPCIIGSTIPGDFDSSDVMLRKSWKQAQHLADAFWRRWNREYLTWLAKRQKWYKDQVPVKIGDIGFLVEDNVIRNLWKRARVEDIDPGKDKIVRKVLLKVATVDPKDPTFTPVFKEFWRPTLKFCKLDLEPSVTPPEPEADVREEECRPSVQNS